MEPRKILPNTGCFAATAKPNNKTLEIFGDACLESPVQPALGAGEHLGNITDHLRVQGELRLFQEQRSFSFLQGPEEADQP